LKRDHAAAIVGNNHPQRQESQAVIIGAEDACFAGAVWVGSDGDMFVGMLIVRRVDAGMKNRRRSELLLFRRQERGEQKKRNDLSKPVHLAIINAVPPGSQVLE